jgi:hypothetical protein
LVTWIFCRWDSVRWNRRMLAFVLPLYPDISMRYEKSVPRGEGEAGAPRARRSAELGVPPEDLDLT